MLFILKSFNIFSYTPLSSALGEQGITRGPAPKLRYVVVECDPARPMRSVAGTMRVLFKLLKSGRVCRPTKLPPNGAMAAVVSVSAAAGDETTDTGRTFASRPLHEKYDLPADHEQRKAGERQHAELQPGDEDTAPGREFQRRVDEDLTSLSPEEIESRLERTRREFYNRRKIIIKNLPSDVSNQVWDV